MENMEIACRGCPKSLKSHQILKHISHSKKCESFYSEKEKSEFKNASKKRKYAKKRNSYDPSKRARMYQESRKKAAKCDLISEEKDNHKELNKNVEMEKTLVKNGHDIECAGCNYSFKKESILKHIAKTENCKRVYSSDDMKPEFQKIQLFAYVSRDRTDKSEYYQKNKDRIAEKYYLHMMVKEQGGMNEDNTNERIECKYCKRKLKVNAILNHIGNSIKCNEYYNLPSSKKKLKMLRKKCKKTSKKKRSEKLGKEKAEEKSRQEKEDFLKMKNYLIKFKESLQIKAKLENEKGFDKAKEKFELEFTRFKEADVASVFKNKIAKLENLSLGTYNMFKCDISNVSAKAECIVKNIDVEDSSWLSGKAERDINNLFKPLIGLEYQTIEKFYTVEEDWHDIQLRIYLELQEIATLVGISFNWSFDCFEWRARVGVCAKCRKTNNLNSKQKIKEDTICYENFQPISEKNKYSIPIRKRKPVNLTMKELEGTTEDDSDYEADVDTTLITPRKMPKRKCVKNTPIPFEGDKI